LANALIGKRQQKAALWRLLLMEFFNWSVALPGFWQSYRQIAEPFPDIKKQSEAVSQFGLCRQL
jgi:hypothetical protein